MADRNRLADLPYQRDRLSTQPQLLRSLPASGSSGLPDATSAFVAAASLPVIGLATNRRLLAAALVHSEGLYVFLISSLGLLDGGERLFAAQHPLLPQSALRTGPISRLYGAFST
jgi:hypothetical protein